MWQKRGDTVLHIKITEICDAMVIAPLSANTLAKISNGLCDTLLTCVFRAWNMDKPVYLCPSMNTAMWENPFTKQHIDTLTELFPNC